MVVFLGLRVLSTLGGPNPSGLCSALGGPVDGVMAPRDGVYGPGEGSLDAPESDILRVGFSSRFTGGAPEIENHHQHSSSLYFSILFLRPNAKSRRRTFLLEQAVSFRKGSAISSRLRFHQ